MGNANVSYFHYFYPNDHPYHAIYQLITYGYFEHQPITDKMVEACCDRVKLIKTIFVTEKFKFFGKKVFSCKRFRFNGLFYTSYKMAISVQNPMLKVNNFL